MVVQSGALRGSHERLSIAHTKPMRSQRSAAHRNRGSVACSSSRSSEVPFRYRTRVARAEDAVSIALLQLDAFSTTDGETSWSRGIWLGRRRGELIDAMQRKMKYNPSERYVAHLALELQQETFQEPTGELLVGTVETSLCEDDSTLLSLRDIDIHAKEYVYTSSMAVARAHRRRGVAKRLMLAVEETARAWNVPHLCLHVEQVNVAACRLYRACGYSIVPTRSRWLDAFGTKKDNLLMHKRLEGVS